MPDRPGDLRGREHRRADLVEQRLEQVMVALVDDGDAQPRPGCGAGEPLTERQTAEACADDDDVMRLGFDQGCPSRRRLLDWGAGYDLGQVNSSSPPFAGLGAS